MASLITGGRPGLLDVPEGTYVLVSHTGSIISTSDNTCLLYIHFVHSIYILYGLLQGSAISDLVVTSNAATNLIGGKGANAHCISALNPFINCRVLFSSVSINLKQYLANLLNIRL
ncbi:hypothetical protein M9H77_06439 [Catharanthus roseus]|uniref:Uncharacterized protein n=1 Tax=Catharanthus roseus TaxID=4058 RepID=A0ACC0BSA6_CATRO|nr:hypothetical protein M9H77_06439 [Catharanthus roseus]